MTDDNVGVVAVITSSMKNEEASTRHHWVGQINARVISVLSKTPEKARQESWLSITKFSGTKLVLQYNGPIMPKVSLRSGILFRFSLSRAEVETALEAVARDEVPILTVEAGLIRPLAQPCVRVPLDLLRELRGQEAITEAARRALVDAWGLDRRTGKALSPHLPRETK